MQELQLVQAIHALFDFNINIPIVIHNFIKLILFFNVSWEIAVMDSHILWSSHWRCKKNLSDQNLKKNGLLYGHRK